MPNPRWFRNLVGWWPVAVALPICLLAVGLSVVVWSIRSGVAEYAGQAQRAFPGDRVEALIAYVESDRHSFRERNLAVWALGQIAAPRALPVLRRHFTGSECQHDRFLCQRELKRAIEACANVSPGTIERAWPRLRRGPD